MTTTRELQTVLLPPEKPASTLTVPGVVKHISPDLLDQLREHIRIHEISQVNLAKQIGVSDAALNKALNGKFVGDEVAFEKACTAFFRSVALHTLTDGDVELFDTLATRQIHKYIEVINSEQKMGLLHGPAGIGKSSGLVMYRRENPTALMVTANRVEGGGPANIIDHIWRQVSTRNFAKRRESRGSFLLKKFAGSKRLLIIDEAHELSPAGRAWVCGWHRETLGPVALIGNPKVLQQFSTLDQQSSLIVFEETIGLKRTTGKVSERDEPLRKAAEDYLQRAWPDAAAEVLPLAIEIVQHKGALRALRHCVSMAKKLIKLKRCEGAAAAFRGAHSMMPRDFDLAA